MHCHTTFKYSHYACGIVDHARPAVTVKVHCAVLSWDASIISRTIKIGKGVFIVDGSRAMRQMVSVQLVSCT